MNLSKAKVLIVGANGLLGSDLYQEFNRFVPEKNLLVPDSKTLDFTKADLVFDFFKKNSPGLVINAAAYTNVDGSETNRQEAYSVNTLGPKNLVEACREFKSRFVHFSTDYVFSGQGSEPWKEEDPTEPPTPNYYAETKLEAEKFALSYSESLVLRVQWLYGKKRDKFALLKEKSVVTPFIDQMGAPCWTREIARAVLQLVEKDISGLYQYAYDDFTNWLEVYQFVKDRLALKVELQPKKLSEMKLASNRPLNCRMSNKKLCEALGITSMGSWKTPLLEYLK